MSRRYIIPLTPHQTPLAFGVGLMGLRAYGTLSLPLGIKDVIFEMYNQ